MPPLGGRGYRVFMSTDGTNFVDTSVMLPAAPDLEQEREVSAEFALNRDFPYVFIGPRKEVRIPINFFYSEATTELFETARASFENRTILHFRFVPSGSGTGIPVYTVSGYVAKLTIASKDANSAEAVKASLELVAEQIVRSTANIS